MFKEMLVSVREKTPLIHNITNYVTVNDCANMLLACGGSPIMTDDADEVEEITSICSGLNINIGTLNQRTIPAMILAGKKSNELGHPVVLDPVGAGASKLRTKTALTLIEEIKFSVIKGNISEIKTLAVGQGMTKGVDANEEDAIQKDDIDKAVTLAKSFARKTGAVIVITGAIDIVADEETAFCVFNGHPDMSKITGTGCQLSAMIAAYVSANPGQMLYAAAAAVCLMGLCGERAKIRMTDLDGNASYRNYIIDAACNITAEELESGAKYEVH